MREIKFRVWDKQEKAYSDKAFSIDQHGIPYVQDEDGYWEEASDRYVFEFSTGLKDMNDKMIREGDIVFFFTEHFDKATGGFDGEDEHNATVEWFDNGFAFIDKIPYDPNIECEVIGTIHEPPKDFRPEHLKRMGVSISKGGEE